MVAETNVVALRSGSKELELYDPEVELKKIVVAEAVERHFIREIKSKEKAGEVLTETLEKLHKASVSRIIGQANYIVWRDSLAVPALGKGGDGSNQHGPNPKASKDRRLRSLLPASDPGDQQAHRWRKFLCTMVRPTEVDEKKVTQALDAVWVRVSHAHNFDDDKKVRGTKGTGENEWYTPVEYLDLVRQVFGGEIDLDPASSAQAQKRVKAKKFYTKKDNGLKKDWCGNVWLNPPYAQPDIAHFAAKMIEEVEVERIEQAIMLTHNYTDTEWFQSLAKVADAICFTAGRIKFESPSGEKAAPTQGQAFFYFGDNVEKFASVFADVGFIAVIRG